jgi:uncharacterized membrane protein
MIHRPADSYGIIKNLRSSGFTDPQAKEILDSIYKNDHHEYYATQTQMQEVKHEINALRIDIQCMHTQLSVIEHKLVYKLGGILISGVAILGILNRYFA